MSVKKANVPSFNNPMLKTVELMSQVSGLGENKLRELMDNREIEFIQNGNRRLLIDSAIIDWYERNKITTHKMSVGQER